MDEKRLGEVTIFRLTSDEFEDARLKNQCLRRTRTPYVAYVAEERIADGELTELVRHMAQTGCVAAAFGRNVQEGQRGYGETMGLLSVSFAALLFPKSLIREVGAFHERLAAQGNFELLCRLAAYVQECKSDSGSEKEASAGGCLLKNVEAQADAAALDEDSACTYAYMMRYHLNRLRAEGLMESVFSLYCGVMQREGLFPIFQQQMNRFLSEEKEYEWIARQTAPFVILRGDETCYGVLQQFADDLAEGLADAGQAVIMLRDGSSVHEKLRNIVCKGIVGFQTHALVIDFVRKMHGPKFQFWFDYPMHYEELLGHLPDDYYVLCQDDDYASLIRTYFHTNNAIQFPPGGIARALCGGERIYDVVFIGSCHAEAENVLSGEEKRYYEYLLEHPSLTFEQGLTDILRLDGMGTEAGSAGGSALDERAFINRMLPLKGVRRRLIARVRNMVVETILGMGIDIHVYGDSWHSYRGSGREHLIIHPQVTVEESLRELAKAKIGLNVMSWHKSGMTERVANIMLSGAVCVTDETAYIQEHMKNGEEIVTFSLERLWELPGLIRKLLSDEAYRERIARCAYDKAIKEYTWQCRAEELIRLAEEAD